MLLSCNCQYLFYVATRVHSESKTLIDHSYTNDVKITNTAGVLASDLSDHFGMYITILGIKTVNNNYKCDNSVRDMTNFAVDDFLTELYDQLYIIFDNNDKAVNMLLNCFVESFTEVMDKFAPMKNATRREKNLKSNPGLQKV